MFNWLTVLILLPLEAASGYLYHLTEPMVSGLSDVQDTGNPKFLKVITDPLTDYIVAVSILHCIHSYSCQISIKCGMICLSIMYDFVTFNFDVVHSRRHGYCPADLPSFDELCDAADDELFSKTASFPNHVLHTLLPPPSTASDAVDGGGSCVCRT